MRLPPGARGLQDALRVAAGLGGGEQQVLGRDVLVAEAPRLLLGTLEQPCRARGSSDSWPPAMRARRDSATPSSMADARRVGAERAQGHRGDALRVREQRGQEVLRVEHGALGVGGEALGGQRSPPAPSRCIGRAAWRCPGAPC